MIRYVIMSLTLAGAAEAQVATGNYAYGQDPQACNPNADSYIEVQATDILFYESACGLTNPRLLPGMGGAVQYTLTCSGEGMEWEDEGILMQADDGGLWIIRPGWVAQYQRC